MSGLALALRLARREVRRRPGRTLLVTLLVALPVAGMVVALVLFRTDRPSPAERWRAANGTADAVLPAVEGGASHATAALPDGARVVLHRSGWTHLRTVDGDRADLVVWELDAGDPLTDGMVDLVDGRFPAAGDEVVVSPTLAAELALAVGDRLEVERPAEVALAVVGVVEDPQALARPLAVTPPGGDLAGTHRRPGTWTGLVDLPEDVAPGALAGVPDLVLRTDVTDQPATGGPSVPWPYVLGGVALTVAGIVVSAAFAAGARRQLVTLGQLSANGAPDRLLRTTLALQGTVTGLVGALAGVALLAAVLATSRDRIEHLLDHRLGPYDVDPLEIAGAAAVGVLAASLAALIPARSVARIPTLAALAGRRPLPPVRRRVTAAGVGAVTLGLVLLGLAVAGHTATASTAGSGSTELWALVGVAGGVLQLLGACALSPALVARLEPLAGRARGTWRLAARSLARERVRTGAVVSAVAAALGLAVAASALVAGGEASRSRFPDLSDRVVLAGVRDLAGDGRTVDAHRPPDPALAAALAAVLPGAEEVTLHAAGSPADWPDGPVPLLADEATLAALDLGDGVAAALAEHGLVALRPLAGVETVTLPDGSQRRLVVADAAHSAGPHWPVLASPALAEDLGLEPAPAALALVAGTALTDDQVADVRALEEDWQLDHARSPSWLDIWVHQPPTGPTPAQIEAVLSGVALVVAAFVVAAGLALAAADARDERDVLTVVGAGPGALARAAGARASLLAGLGALMAVPLGLLPVAVYVAVDDGSMPLVVPWRTVGLVGVALPVALAAAAVATSAAALRLRPVRVSTAVFD